MPLPQNQLAAIPVQAGIPLQVYTGPGSFSWAPELRHLLSIKFLKILGWPFFKFRQRWFTHSAFIKSCKKLPGFKQLWNTIQKGAYAYNSLFLGLSPFCRHQTDLADITTLALFFGDEFIDGLAETAGKPFIRQLLKEHQQLFYLQMKIRTNKASIRYYFDLNELLPAEILRQVNSKYKISYYKFYELLRHFLELINKYLDNLPATKAEKIARKITDACNSCFESFLHDVNRPHSDVVPDVTSVLHFHESKTAYMQEKLLELRCILAGKEEMMYSIQTPGWLDIMRVVQIYDDIQDMVIDDGLQDNILLSVAFHYFPQEWTWFSTHRNLLQQENLRLVLFSRYMPGSMEYCMRLAGDKIKTMNWEQQKIMHYLLFRNKYILYKKNKEEDCQNDFLFQFYKQVKDIMPHLSIEMIKAFVIDTFMHVKEARKKILDTVDFSKAYQLQYDLFLLSASDKAAIFDKATVK